MDLSERASASVTLPRPFLFVGPALIVSIAFIDPGNIAVNIQAGSKYGYALLWVALGANLIAILFQSLAAKLGLATGRDLAQLCRERFSRPVASALWIASEFAAMATDLAEFVGAAVGLSLLMNIKLMPAMVLAGLLTSALLWLQRFGLRTMELMMGAFAVAIGICYFAELAISGLDWGETLRGSFIPNFPDSGAVAVAAAIIGATLMPHALFLHSDLAQERFSRGPAASRGRVLAASNAEVRLVLICAGLVNMAMIAAAAAAFHAGHPEVEKLETAYELLQPLLGSAAAAVFLTALLASGLASSTVGTMAGQTIMRGFVGFSIPIWTRRLVTMLPAFAIIGAGVDVTQALIGSQIALSFALPAPLIPLILFTRDKRLMGELVNSRVVDFSAIAVGAALLALNAALVAQALGFAIPGLG